MAVYVEKPGFNLREKLSELDYAKVPYEKMPTGSIIQVSQTTTRNNVRGTVDGASGFADPGEGFLFITTEKFCPIFSNSKILLQTSNICVSEYTNVTDDFFMTAYVKQSGDNTVHARMSGCLSYESFSSAFNAQVMSFNHIIDADVWRGIYSEVDIRIGPRHQASVSSVAINRDTYAGSQQNNQNLVSVTLMEIRQ